jgi:DNA-binding response OmpR family regulator
MNPASRVIAFPQRADEVVSVLHLTAWEEERNFLARIFDHTKWKIVHASSLREACSVLRRLVVPVVLTETALPDAAWPDIVRETARYSPSPRIIATYRFSESDRVDPLLASGAYDVVAKPFDVSEVLQSISFAWMRWKNDWSQLTPPRKPPMTMPAAMALAAKASG